MPAMRRTASISTTGSVIFTGNIAFNNGRDGLEMLRSRPAADGDRWARRTYRRAWAINSTTTGYNGIVAPATAPAAFWSPETPSPGRAPPATRESRPTKASLSATTSPSIISMASATTAARYRQQPGLRQFRYRNRHSSGDLDQRERRSTTTASESKRAVIDQHIDHFQQPALRQHAAGNLVIGGTGSADRQQHRLPIRRRCAADRPSLYSVHGLLHPGRRIISSGRPALHSPSWLMPPAKLDSTATTTTSMPPGSKRVGMWENVASQLSKAGSLPPAGCRQHFRRSSVR